MFLIFLKELGEGGGNHVGARSNGLKLNVYNLLGFDVFIC